MLILARVAAGQGHRGGPLVTYTDWFLFICKYSLILLTWVWLQVLGGLCHDVQDCPRSDVHPLKGKPGQK